MKKIKTILILTFLLVSCFTFSVYGFQLDDVSGSNWMSIIKSDSKITEITIPGTHDSGAQFANLSFKTVCQDSTIQKQLYDGYRYFDIRLEKENNKMKLVHGFIDCKIGTGIGADKLYFEKVSKWFYDFLEENPTETVILTVKEEHGSAGEEFPKCLFNEYISKNPDKWYIKNEIPTLGDVRGKIVLVYREDLENVEGFTDENCGINFSGWKNQDDQKTDAETFEIKSISTGNTMAKVNMQDRYKLSADTKWEQAVVSILDRNLNTEEFNINFFSTSTGWGPKSTSKKINNNFMKYELKTDKCYGILVLDYANEDLARKVYLANKGVVDEKAQIPNKFQINMDSTYRGIPWSIVIGVTIILLIMLIRCLIVKRRHHINKINM